MECTDAQRAATDQADMLRYFTDSEAFRKENEQLDARIVALRIQYDAKIDTIRPALQDLMDRPVAFKVQTLHLVLPSMFKRLVNLVATALTAGMNFMREAVDGVVDHVQGKVAHFHHALLVIGNVVDERLTTFSHKLQGFQVRLRGMERHLGLSAEQASSRASTAMPEADTISGRLTDLEAKFQRLRGDYLLLNLRHIAKEASSGSAPQRRGHGRAPSPANSGSSRLSASSLGSRASSAHEAALHLAVAQSENDTPAMISAAQSIAYFRRHPAQGEDDQL